MLMVLRPRLVPNCTCRAGGANGVSSPPRPTSSPGWKWVPRCRTMISPALTSWPPKRFTPSRWAFESRPLREELAPFLCAMVVATPRSAGLDAGHAQPGEPLPMTLPRVLTGLVLELVDADLRGFDRPDALGRARDAGERLRIGGHVAAVDDQHCRQGHAVTRRTRQLLDVDDVTDSHLVL